MLLTKLWSLLFVIIVANEGDNNLAKADGEIELDKYLGNVYKPAYCDETHGSLMSTIGVGYWIHYHYSWTRPTISLVKENGRYMLRGCNPGSLTNVEFNLNKQIDYVKDPDSSRELRVTFTADGIELTESQVWFKNYKKKDMTVRYYFYDNRLSFKMRINGDLGKYTYCQYDRVVPRKKWSFKSLLKK